MMAHLIDKVCSCMHCLMIDIMWGDPLLTPWEYNFVKSVASFGWRNEYSPKQKAVIQKIFRKQRQIYTHPNHADLKKAIDGL